MAKKIGESVIERRMLIKGKEHKMYDLRIDNTIGAATIMWLGAKVIQKVRLAEDKYVYVINEELFKYLEAIEVE